MPVSFYSFPDIEDQLDSVPNGLTGASSLLERLQHAEQRAELAEAALASAQDDLQKMRFSVEFSISEYYTKLMILFKDHYTVAC